MRIPKLYFGKIPGLIRWSFQSLVWKKDPKIPMVYLTFDDGPTPGVTDWVLELLNKHEVKATFFSLGENVESNQKLFQQILSKGHRVGNHSHHHLDGWKVNDSEYLADVNKAAQVIPSRLFRPPYGRIKPSQIKKLKDNYEIIMWDVMAGDFDEHKSIEQCKQGVLSNVKNGSIIVFHDNEKAFETLKGVLEEVITQLNKRGYRFGVL